MIINLNNCFMVFKTEQINDKVSIIRNTLVWLSGVNSKVIKSLPYEDKKPYLKLGLLNLSISTFITLAAYFIGKILFDFSSIESLIFCSFYFVASIYLQKIITGNLTNKETGESKFSFFLGGVLISLLISFSILVIRSDDKIIVHDKKKKDTYLLLDSYVKNIQSRRKDSTNNNFVKNVFGQKKSVINEFIYLFLDSYITYYKNFAEQSYLNLKLLSLKDSSEIIEKVNSLSDTIRNINNQKEHEYANLYFLDTIREDNASYNIKSSDSIWSKSVTTNQIHTARILVDRLFSIPISKFTEITSYFDPNRFKTLQFNEKIGIVSSYIDSSTVSLFIIVFIIMMLFYFFISIISNTYNNDLYHQLLLEEEKLNSEVLEKQRKKISEIYKTQLDIRQFKKAFIQASTVDNIDKEQINDIVTRLNDDYTSATLSTVAEIETKQGNFIKSLEYVNKAIELDFENPELWLSKSAILNQLGRPAEELEAKSRYLEYLGKANFERNLNQKIVLQEIEFRNLPFYGSFSWKLKPTINVLLGKNGYGKSHLLSIVLAQLQEETTALIQLSRINSTNILNPTEKCFLSLKINNGDVTILQEAENIRKKINEFVTKKMEIEQLLMHPIGSDTGVEYPSKNNMEAELNQISKEIDLKYERLEQITGRSFFDKTGSIQSLSGKIPVLAIPDLRFVNKSSDSTLTITEDKAKKLLEFGAYHFINQLPYENTIQNFLNTICIIYYNDSKTFKDEIFQIINRVFKTLSGNEFKWIDIYPTQDNSGNIIKVQTEGNGEPLPIQKVSQGTLSILSIVGVIFHYLSLRYPDVKRDNLCKQQAIVFIDEIDAHLHPSWQQKLIGIMRREFPNIQFIITAHSPLIIAGCKEDEVAVMREMRSDTDKSIKGFYVEKIFEDFIGFTTDELYRKIFEIENKDETYLKYISLIPGKSEMEERAKILKDEKNKDSLSPDKESELAQLNEDIYYIKKVKQKEKSLVDVGKLKMENEMLRMELEIERSNSNI